MRVVVVGAGPAGMAAARAAADHGARTMLVDAEPVAGGQFHRGERLSFAHPGVTHLPDTTAWALEGTRLHLRTGPADSPARVARVLDADALVLATGAHDRVLPFPGWDLPGVVTAGAAQALAKQHGVPVGRRVLVAGVGPFLLPVATALRGLGVDIAAVVDAAAPQDWLREPAAMLAGRAKFAELARYRAILRHYRARHAVVAFDGETATVARVDHDWRVRAGTARRIAADAVCVGFGFTPRLDLAAECLLDDGFVRVDARQATSVPGVYAAGEITGIGGAGAAVAEGVVAGTAAAGGVPSRESLRAVRRARVFAAGLARVTGVRPGWRTWPTPDTLVCRCEEVPAGALVPGLGLRALKLTTRVGMGLCQGRICLRNAAELADVPYVPPRVPLATPLRLGELADTPVDLEEQ